MDEPAGSRRKSVAPARMQDPPVASVVGGAASSTTAITGVDAWEIEQLRQRELPQAKALPLSADYKTINHDLKHDAHESWEDDLGEAWSAMQLRLEVALRSNPLDYEKKCVCTRCHIMITRLPPPQPATTRIPRLCAWSSPTRVPHDHRRPFSEKTVEVTDGKTTDGTPVNVRWIPMPGDGNNKENSDHVMMGLKMWDIELPNMCVPPHPLPPPQPQQKEARILLCIYPHGRLRVGLGPPVHGQMRRALRICAYACACARSRRAGY